MIDHIAQRRYGLALLLLGGLAAFAAAYGIINFRLMVANILYAWAAGRTGLAIANAWSFIAQGALLAIVIALLPRFWFVVITVTVLASGLVNVVYAQILGRNIDLAGMIWILAEHRQSMNAFSEFFRSFAVASAKVAIAIVLLAVARRMLAPVVARCRLRRVQQSFVLGALVVLSYGAAHAGAPVIDRLPAAEINAFPLFIKASLQTYPDRGPIAARPSSPPEVSKIVWLVDESVASHWFHLLFQPGLSEKYDALDYGDAESMGNCSAQSNSALRWGVDVGAITPATDLRRTATIWKYAEAAGFTTTLLDGQVRGATQDNIWPPERALIEHYFPSANGITTDRQLAARLNAMLKEKGRQFVYVVLRGSHYQYHGNYPPGAVPPGSPLIAQYKESVAYSKQGFFETLFAGVDRNDVAVFYTSDHGQIIKPGVVPHCNEAPHAEEYAVPLLLFVPPRLRAGLVKPPASPWMNSHSQIFPTTLVLMGYDRAFSESHFDHLLPAAPKRLITFGKRITPNQDQPTIQLRVNRVYPPFPG